MPSKYSIKTFTENAYYHVYNRGVEKRRIFHDREDYLKFIYYLKIYLSTLDDIYKEQDFLRLNLERNNLSKEVSLVTYCLMPNHFHLLLHQSTKNAITRLMKQLATAYAMHYNKRYGRVGPLFQGRFKAIPIETDEYLLHLSRYIHLNPLERGASLSEFEWSSYLNYIEGKPSSWVKTELILNYMRNTDKEKDYKSFVEGQASFQLPNDLLLDQV